MMKYFVRGIMLVNIVFFYSTVSFTKSRFREYLNTILGNQTALNIINNFETLNESQMREAIWISNERSYMNLKWEKL